MVAAAIYVVFAAFGGASPGWLLVETMGVAFYSVFAVLGMRRSRLWLAAGWAAHPAWDGGLHMAGHGAAFSPAWYVVACISFDLLVAAYVLIRARRGSRGVRMT